MDLKDVRIGENKVARLYHKDEVVYPNTINDGLVMWYDFMGCSNNDPKRDIAEDLSGNYNNGNLINFAYEENSGYENGLLFDGVDDYIEINEIDDFGKKDFTIEILIKRIEHRPRRAVFSNSGKWSDPWTERGVTLTYISNPLNLYFYVNDGSGYAGYAIGGTESAENVFISIIREKDTIKILKNGEFLHSDIKVDEYANFDNISKIFMLKGIKSDLKSIRLHKRALTEVEILHNYQMEKERWNL